MAEQALVDALSTLPISRPLAGVLCVPGNRRDCDYLLRIDCLTRLDTELGGHLRSVFYVCMSVFAVPRPWRTHGRSDSGDFAIYGARLDNVGDRQTPEWYHCLQCR